MIRAKEFIETNVFSIATTLLLIVFVILIFGFQGWCERSWSCGDSFITRFETFMFRYQTLITLIAAAVTIHYLRKQIREAGLHQQQIIEHQRQEIEERKASDLRQDQQKREDEIISIMGMRRRVAHSAVLGFTDRIIDAVNHNRRLNEAGGTIYKAKTKLLLPPDVPFFLYTQIADEVLPSADIDYLNKIRDHLYPVVEIWAEIAGGEHVYTNAGYNSKLDELKTIRSKVHASCELLLFPSDRPQ